MSALDARIRHLAREELAAASAPQAEESSEQLTALEAKVTELSATVARLESRFDSLEKTVATAGSTARRTRKAADE